MNVPFCMQGVIRSKRNSAFAAETSTGPDSHFPGSSGAGQSHCTYPKWTATDFDMGIHPILPDKGYLEQQHMLIAVKSAEDDESYGQFSLHVWTQLEEQMHKD